MGKRFETRDQFSPKGVLDALGLCLGSEDNPKDLEALDPHIREEEEDIQLTAFASTQVEDTFCPRPTV